MLSVPSHLLGIVISVFGFMYKQRCCAMRETLGGLKCSQLVPCMNSPDQTRPVVEPRKMRSQLWGFHAPASVPDRLRNIRHVLTRLNYVLLRISRSDLRSYKIGVQSQVKVGTLSTSCRRQILKVLLGLEFVQEYLPTNSGFGMSRVSNSSLT